MGCEPGSVYPASTAASLCGNLLSMEPGGVEKAGPRPRVSGTALIVGLILSVSLGLLAAGAYGIVDSLGPRSLPHGIAFQSDVDGHQEIYVINPAAGEITRVTENRDGHDGYPAWSPDGKRLAYSSGSDVQEAIYILDSSGVRQLTEKGSVKGFARWSPDGWKIAYYTFQKEGGKPGTLRVINADGSGQTPVFPNDTQSRQTGDCFDGFPGGWFPGGQRLLYRGSLQGTLAICAVNADGSDVQVILADKDRESFDPALSPDGSRIAFVSGNGKDQIFLMNADGTRPRPLISDDADDKNPTWSPDGQWIAFSSNRNGSHYHIYVVRADGTDLRQLTDWGGDDRWPSWSSG